MAGSRNPTVSGVSVLNSGVLPTTLALHGLQKPTLESLCRVDQHAGDQGLLRVAPRRSPRALVSLRASRWRLSGRLLQTPLLLYTYERPGQGRTCREVGAQSLRALLEIRQPGCQREI